MTYVCVCVRASPASCALFCALPACVGKEAQHEKTGLFVCVCVYAYRFGGTLVSKKLLAKPRRNLNPLILLDYRCYAPDGKIGTAFDPQLTQVRMCVCVCVCASASVRQMAQL